MARVHHFAGSGCQSVIILSFWGTSIDSGNNPTIDCETAECLWSRAKIRASELL